MNVGQLYAMQARKMRNKPAVIYRGRMLTHAELNRLSNQLAQALLQLGYQKGEHIVILAKNHLEYPVIMLAAAKIGVSFTPLNYRLTPGELLSIVGHCQPRGIFLQAISRTRSICFARKCRFARRCCSAKRHPAGNRPTAEGKGGPAFLRFWMVGPMRIRKRKCLKTICITSDTRRGRRADRKGP